MEREEGRDVFQRWEQQEKSRRDNFTKVMKERRRLKDLSVSPSVQKSPSPTAVTQSPPPKAQLKPLKTKSPSPPQSERMTLMMNPNSSTALKK
jgi:hypothetical protein